MSVVWTSLTPMDATTKPMPMTSTPTMRAASHGSMPAWIKPEHNGGQHGQEACVNQRPAQSGETSAATNLRQARSDLAARQLDLPAEQRADLAGQVAEEVADWPFASPASTLATPDAAPGPVAW